jgi:hypothetical protein
MNMQDAKRQAGDSGRLCLPDNKKWYCLIVDGRPFWYENSTDCVQREVSGREAILEDWEVCQRAKEIRPKKGEVWKFKSNAYPHYIIEEGSVLHFTWVDGSSEMVERSDTPLIHNKNGWTRLFPKVEDGSVERIEIERVIFGRIEGANGAKYMSIISTSCDGPSLDVFNDKTMKAIFEIPKDKP